jgi:hypothetical protein
VIADHALELLSSSFLDEFVQNLLVFLLEVVESLLKELMAGVLADVSEVSYRFLQSLSVTVLTANVDDGVL